LLLHEIITRKRQVVAVNFILFREKFLQMKIWTK
jgi:hypothetical protein